MKKLVESAGEGVAGHVHTCGRSSLWGGSGTSRTCLGFDINKVQNNFSKHVQYVYLYINLYMCYFQWPCSVKNMVLVVCLLKTVNAYYIRIGVLLIFVG